MSFTIQNIYLLFAWIFLLILCINLTIHIVNIYQIEHHLHLSQAVNNQKRFNESLAYNISHLLLRKNQLIEAVQTLQKVLRHKQLQDSLNNYSLSNLSNALGCIYNRVHKYSAAIYYFRLALFYNYRHIEALDNLAQIYSKTSARSG